VEVEVRGSGLAGADHVIVNGAGVSGTVSPGAAKPDEKFKPIWQAKCSGCHELRSPSNRSMTPAQWAATVDRMIKVRQAPLSSDEATKVSDYLQGLARAGRVTAQIKIAQDIQPGLYEVRLATPAGVSTACLFEVGSLPEVIGVNGKRDQAQAVAPPCVANGSLVGNAERHFYRFAAKSGQRMVFNLKAFRYNESSQMYFNPNLRLYDSGGSEIAENHGYYDLDPLIDWTPQTDGEYTLEVRDLLGRGNPGNVYRLTMGAVPYDTVLYPPAAQVGVKSEINVVGKNEGSAQRWSLGAQELCGLTTLSSPAGPEPFYVTRYPVIKEEDKQASSMLPAGFTGRISQPGESDSFTLQGKGAYEFEAFGSRVGSPVKLTVQILNAKGKAIARINGEGRSVATLDAGQTYSLKVEDSAGQGGPEFVYFIEARPAGPALNVVTRPDSITVRPGMSTPVEVYITRRERSDGDVVITAEDLPPGVKVTPVVISPDRQEGRLILTADTNAAITDRPIRIVATAHGGGEEVKVTAIPQETYLINNQPRYLDRTECLLSVRGEAPIKAVLVTGGPIRVHPRKGTEVKVRIERQGGYKGPVTVRITNLPSGWVASPETLPNGKSEVTLLVRPDGNNTAPFLKRDAKYSTIVCVVEAIVDDYPYAVATQPVLPADRITDDENKP
jgi:hypothetical protein